MQYSISKEWHSRDTEGKLEMLRMALITKDTIHVQLLDEDVRVLDKLAAPLGFSAIYVSTVDACGLSDRWTPAVVAPEVALRYRSRKFSA
jgi:hypothetical protein